MTNKSMFLILILIVLAVSSVLAQDTYFGQNKVQYKNFDWYYIQTPNFDIYFYKGEDTLATFAAHALEKACGEIKEQLNFSLTSRVPILIYASHNEFEQTNVVSDLIPEGVGGFTEIFKNRIVIPFTGSYEDFRHVLHHELPHATWFELLYGNALKALLSPEALFRPPLWFSEGYAEFASRHGWDLEADMYMRDATVQGYLPPLDYLDGFLAYKGGQCVLEFVSEKYGEEKIPEILNKGKALITMERGTKAALGVSLKDLSDEWQKALKRVYWPELAARKEPAEFAKALTDHTKDGSVFNQKPAWSPRGDRLAFFSDRNNPRNGYSDRFNDVYIISAIDGKIISRVVKAERSGDLESLHSYWSGLGWSPDGNELVFAGKSKGRDMLLIYDANSGKRKKHVDFKMEAIRNPAWSADGKKIVFDGIKDGFSDLYVYDISSKKLSILMKDKYDDNEPSWSKDGRFVAFSSDRPIGKSNSIATDSTGHDSTSAKYGEYNIFLYDMQEHAINPIIVSAYKDYQPAFSPDGKRIAFVSNRNGIDNIYVYEMDSKKTFPVTDIISGAFSPSWNPDGDQLAFSSFFKYGFDIDILKDIKDVGDENGELKPTPYMEKLRKGDRNIFVAPIPIPANVAGAKPETTIVPTTLDFSTYVFHAPDKDTTAQKAKEPNDTLALPVELPDSISLADSLKAEKPEKAKIGNPREADSTYAGKKDTLQYLLPDGSFKENHYKLKFAPELVTGGFSYDNFYGLQGQSYLAISDLLGNHHFYLLTDLVNSIDQSNIQIAYENSTRRTDFGISLFHFNNLYFNNAQNFFFSDRIYGGSGSASYPFSKFSRLDFSLNQITVSRQNFVAVTDSFPDRTTDLLAGIIEYVNDAVIWGLTGPVAGQRYKIQLEKSVKLGSNGLSYISAEFDFRKYLYFMGRYNFAMRLGGGASDGRNPKSFYLGGTSNWITSRTSKADIFSVQDIYVNEIVVPIRGYDFFTAAGTRFAITNFEFRYPFIDYFKLHFPLPITLAEVSGAIFWDMGVAWNDSDDSRIMRELRFYDPVKQRAVPNIAPQGIDVLAGFGFGPRVNLGIFVLRVDLAWGTNLVNVTPKPKWYFSLGAEF